MATIIEQENLRDNNSDPRPRYDLTPEELAVLEASLVDSVRERFPEEGVYAAIIEPNHEYANVVRAYEAKSFPEVSELEAEIEENTRFLALVDTRSDSSRVVHASTITGFKHAAHKDAPDEIEARGSESTGFVVIDDLVSMGNFTPQEFRDFYAARGIDLDGCISLETNFRVGQRVPKFNGIDTVDLAYLTIFSQFLQNEPAPRLGEAVVFASINRASLVSFGRVGLKYLLLMDRNDLLTSEAAHGLQFTPVAIPYDADNQGLFEGMGLQPSEAVFSRDNQ
ncbi:MAG: hypothetical protein AAB834_05100 [Patescibacteria group bacterium]